MKFPRQMKYIVSENGVLLFSESIKHSDLNNLNPISAGYVRLEPDNDGIKVSIYGESVSLGLHSRDSDAVLIETTINEIISC